VTLDARLQRAVDAGELVFPVDVEGRGAVREVLANPRTGRPCVGSQGSAKAIEWERQDGVDFNNPRRRSGQTYKHGAVDIFGGVGTYCYAIEDAVVELMPAGSNAGPHGMRLRGRFGVWLYSHMSERDVDHGDEVRAGDLVGRLGAEGNVLGCPHLHFGWRAPSARGNGGRQLDPAELLRALEARATGRREPSDAEGPTVDGDDRTLEVLSRSVSTAERLLLDIADQWEDGGTQESRFFAEQLRSAVATSRSYWRENPARTIEAMEQTALEATRVRVRHPEWFDRPGLLDDVQRALELARDALREAAGAGAAFAMDFGLIGLGILALFTFGGRSR
jgi:hypothetical protein